MVEASAKPAAGHTSRNMTTASGKAKSVEEVQVVQVVAPAHAVQLLQRFNSFNGFNVFRTLRRDEMAASEIRTFEDLEVWKIGRQLTKVVYGLTRKDDFSRDFGLSDQARRAAVSVMSNVAAP